MPAVRNCAAPAIVIFAPAIEFRLLRKDCAQKDDQEVGKDDEKALHGAVEVRK